VGAKRRGERRKRGKAQGAIRGEEKRRKYRVWEVKGGGGRWGNPTLSLARKKSREKGSNRKKQGRGDDKRDSSR